ncbi:MAG: hypothetical protein Q8900_09800 [Bacillota bacterium]|nr:hypothetical protein [Bacillota bacterium]
MEFNKQKALSRAKEMIINGDHVDDILHETQLRLKDIQRLRDEVAQKF